MTEPEPSGPSVDGSKIIAAARDADATRCAHVMITVYRDTDQLVFARAELVAAWSRMFPGDRQVAATKANKAGQLLARTVAVIRDTTSYIIGDTTILGWLGDRHPLVLSTPPGRTLPLNDADLALIEQMLIDRQTPPDPDPEPEPEPEPDPPGEGG
jgi:hypothetical protein